MDSRMVMCEGGGSLGDRVPDTGACSTAGPGRCSGRWHGALQIV